MPETPSLFEEQAREQPDATSRAGKKIVYDDDSEDDVPTLPDGRFDGRDGWAHDYLCSMQARGDPLTHNQQALLMLYRNRRVTRRIFWDQTGSAKLPARIADLRQIDDCPPIRTDEESDPTEWFIPHVSEME